MNDTEEIPKPEGEAALDGPFLLVGNPTSKSGKAAHRIERARELLVKHGIAHEFKSTLPSGGTVDLVRAAIVNEGYRRLIFLGGDGTFNEVAKGICASGLAREVVLGMLPSGTANDQGKSYGLSSSSRQLERNVRVIAAGYTEKLDVGEVTALSDTGLPVRRDLFFDSMGFGLSAAILAFRNNELGIIKKLPLVRDMYRDHMIYIRAAARELALSWFTGDSFAAAVELDGQRLFLENLTDLIISNTVLYAGEWVIDREAKADDGLFEIAPFTSMMDWTSKLIVQHKKVPLTEQMLNRIGVSHSPVYRAGRITIQLVRAAEDRKIPAQIDGEEFPAADRIEIQVYPELLTLIVPENHHWI